MKPGLAIQPWGNYSLALAASVECLRVEPWTQRSTVVSVKFSKLVEPAFLGYKV